MRAKTTNGASHCIMATAQGQKWVVGNVTTINGDNGDVTDEPLPDHLCYQKGLSVKRIVPGNPDFADMSWGRTRPTMTWVEGNKVGKGQPTKNNNQPLMGAVQ